MNRDEQINAQAKSYVEKYAKRRDFTEDELYHLEQIYRLACHWADNNPKDVTDWKQVRIQTAIAAMQGMLSNESIKLKTNEEAAIFSVNIADALVEELKGE